MRGPVLLLCCFVVGLGVGRADCLPAAYSAAALDITLWALLVGAGMCMGFDVRIFGVLRALGPRIALVPLGTAAGTAAGALAAWGLLYVVGKPMSLQDVLGVGAGFGYYSLSSVMITRLGDAALGSVALLANVTRELLTLLCAPLLVRMAGGLGPVATGGAASMDTCMPVIARYAGERFALIGIFSGMALTIAVPFLVLGIFAL